MQPAARDDDGARVAPGQEETGSAPDGHIAVEALQLTEALASAIGQRGRGDEGGGGRGGGVHVQTAPPISSMPPRWRIRSTVSRHWYSTETSAVISGSKLGEPNAARARPRM